MPAHRLLFMSYQPTQPIYRFGSSAGDTLRKQNDMLTDIWCELDGLFPSVYQFYNSENNTAVATNNRQYVYSNVAEAVRIADMVPSICNSKARPLVMVYTWHLYHSGLQYCCDQDEEMTWIQSFAAGADALVMWGYAPDSSSATNFSHWYLSDFAPMVNNWHPPHGPHYS